MGRLIKIILAFLFSHHVASAAEVPEELNWYRQIELNLTDSFIVLGKDIPNEIRDWPIIKQQVLRSGGSGLFFMKMTNRLALVPEFPVITCFKNTSAQKHNGSKVIAVSRTPVTLENQTGRYAILQTSEPDYVCTTWLDEVDAKTLFKSLGDFDPSIQPLPFPEVRDRENSERSAAEREQKAIGQIANAKKLQKNNRKPDSFERDSKRKMNSSDEEDTGKFKTDFSVWIIGSVLFCVLLVGIWKLKRKQRSCPSR